MRRRKQKSPFATEAELCAAFIADAARQGWQAYPETCGYDLVLERQGTQIGIQAKMRFNATLLRQVLPTRFSNRQERPHFLGILLPQYSLDVLEVCWALGVSFWCPKAAAPYCSTAEFWPTIQIGIRWDNCDGTPLTLPKYRPDVVAGASGPIQLTEWKVRALRLCAVLEINGHLTVKDFTRHCVDRRRWILPFNGWLTIENGVYVRGPGLRFPEQHPEVFKQILAEERAAAEGLKG